MANLLQKIFVYTKSHISSIYLTTIHQSKTKLCLDLIGLVLRLILIIGICLNVYLNLAYPLATFEEINYVLNSPTGQLNYQHIRPILLFFIIPFVIINAILIISNKILGSNWIKSIQTVCLIFILTTTCYYSNQHYNFYESIMRNRLESDFIRDNYQDPNNVTITAPVHKKNLIHIYLESMEMTFASAEFGGAKNNNVIPELTELALQPSSDSFSGDNSQLNGAVALYGSTWTMGSTFSHETGLPLKISGLDGNNMSIKNDFFDTTISLGDILEENGYKNVIMSGSDLNFAGAKNFFIIHGNSDIQDYHYFKKQKFVPDNYYVWWGVEDFKLIDFAKQELKNLSNSGTPFNLTLFTLDTHFEDGYLCDHCDESFDDQYSNVIHCSSKQIADFVEWCKGQDFYKDTVIIITGDHPTMDSDYCNDVNVSYQRKTFVTVNNAEKHSVKNRVYSTFDLFPTILSSLGFSIEGNRLGLGTDLFSNTPTLLETYGITKLNNELAKHSSFMDNLSNTVSLSYFNRHYSDINDFLSDLINENKQRDLVVMITSYGDFDKVLNHDSINLLGQLNLTTLSGLASKNDGFYVGIVHGTNTYEQYNKEFIYYHEKFDGFNILLSCGIHNNKKYNAALLFDKPGFMMPQNDGINIAVYDLGLNIFAKGINFAPK